jgi:4-amino-4-deoxy-L-arabinose transferase-like glycosyltransferase
VPVLAAVLYLLFGVQEWVGRAVSVGFFLLSVPLLYLLVKQVANATSALLAVTIYLVAPLSVFVSRAFMPDMAALSCSLLALYLFAAWLAHEANSRLFLAATCATCLALLIKITYLIIGIPLLYLAWRTYGVKCFRCRKLWVYAAVSLMIPGLWYAHAYLNSRSYVPCHFFGEDGLAIRELAWYGNILYYLVMWSLMPAVVGAMVLGALCPAHGPFRRLFHRWLLAHVVFVVVAGYGNRHQWYQLPMVPVAAAFGGIAWEAVLRQGAHDRRASALACTACLAFLGRLRCSPTTSCSRCMTRGRCRYGRLAKRSTASHHRKRWSWPPTAATPHSSTIVGARVGIFRRSPFTGVIRPIAALRLWSWKSVGAKAPGIWR